jgi:hypothetical protein
MCELSGAGDAFPTKLREVTIESLYLLPRQSASQGPLAAADAAARAEPSDGESDAAACTDRWLLAYKSSNQM